MPGAVRHRGAAWPVPGPLPSQRVLVFSDALTQALAWREASERSHDVYCRLEYGLDQHATALAVFGDYSAAATTPPIPTLLYKIEKPRLERAWRATSG